MQTQRIALGELRSAMLLKTLIDKGYPRDIAEYLVREIMSGRLKLMEQN